MTKEDIELFLNLAYSKAEYDLMFKRTAKDHNLFSVIWEMAKEKPPKEVWRLLWILDHATEKKNDFIFPILDEIYTLVLKTDNESCIRHGMKLLMRCPINEDFAGGLLERCIKWMNDPKAKISSQVLGLEFFYKICQLYPEMAPELLAHIDEVMERKPSAGMNVRLRQIREQLEK